MCPSYSSHSLLSSIEGWSCSRNSDHEVTLRMKASARNGKTERERSLDIDDLVDSGLPVSGLTLHDSKDILWSKALFCFGGGGGVVPSSQTRFLYGEIASWCACLCVRKWNTEQVD